jgi:chromodomain-helicase-DNA-binding protein 7
MSQQETKRKKLDSIVKGLSAARTGGEKDSLLSALGGSLLESELQKKEDKGALNLSGGERKSDKEDKGRLPHFGRANITITPIPPKSSTPSSSASGSSSSSSSSHKLDSKESKVHRWLEQMSSSQWDFQKLAKAAAAASSAPIPSTSGTQKSHQQSSQHSALRQRLNVSPSPSRSATPGTPSTSAAASSSAVDWNKMSGEENVPVVHRITGKKVTWSPFILDYGYEDARFSLSTHFVTIFESYFSSQPCSSLFGKLNACK